MPIKLDYDVARTQFHQALARARAEGQLPPKWLERTSKVGQAPSKTFVAMLGTALLAKATDPRIDPSSLKTRAFKTAYSARSLCKDVLVPCAVEAGVHLGTTGREPLNNQPFFRHERVGPDMTVRPHVRPHVDYLCECLEAIKPLSQAQALDALAAFLRIRAQEGPPTAEPLQVERTLAIPELLGKIQELISANPENGKRGQAFVAAALDLVFDEVRTTRVFDPSRHWPGDVVVCHDDDTISLAVEVKQRPALHTEIVQFTERCAQMGVHRAIAATLAPDQAPLDIDELRQDAWQRHNVHLSILEDPGQVLYGALTWSAKDLEAALTTFPQLMATRLAELEVSAEGQAAWAALFKHDA